MGRLIKVETENDIFPHYQDTPVALLFKYHNMNRDKDKYTQAQLLIGMCMDHRKSLRIPNNFAYILRSAGANFRHKEFMVSYAIGVGKIKHIAIIGHNNCGMTNLISKKDEYVKGLVEIAGWQENNAEEYFLNNEPLFRVSDEMDFVLSEANRLRSHYPKIQVAPLFYKLDDNMLYQIAED
ncbi:MAG: carbonic anhydrase [Peptococcia bacterium]